MRNHTDYEFYSHYFLYLTFLDPDLDMIFSVG